VAPQYDAVSKSELDTLRTELNAKADASLNNLQAETKFLRKLILQNFNFAETQILQQLAQTTARFETSVHSLDARMRRQVEQSENLVTYDGLKLTELRWAQRFEGSFGDLS
jgi:septal ring factor EnvC (AmiA/AmiB activator)